MSPRISTKLVPENRSPPCYLYIGQSFSRMLFKMVSALDKDKNMLRD
ncbi:hypothetical protein PG989_016114 [Apiospora arundinis]